MVDLRIPTKYIVCTSVWEEISCCGLERRLKTWGIASWQERWWSKSFWTAPLSQCILRHSYCTPDYSEARYKDTIASPILKSFEELGMRDILCSIDIGI
jgi:hypothetical protein